jgi:mxaJ protein
MSTRFPKISALLLILPPLWAGCQAPSVPATMLTNSPVLRVCADPNNLPFSNHEGAGFENRIAEVVAHDLGAQLEYVWWAQRRGFIRNTLRAGLCDVVIGVPADLAMTATTRPYYQSAYVFITRAGDPAPTSLDDPWLKRVTVGVHLIGDDGANTPPAHALSARSVIGNVRGYSIYGDYAEPDPPARLIRAVADREIDVAVAWGPLAGYFTRLSPVALQIALVTPREEQRFRFEFDIAMGVSRDNLPLRDRLNTIIQARGQRITAILRDFGVPLITGGAKVASR